MYVMYVMYVCMYIDIFVHIYIYTYIHIHTSEYTSVASAVQKDEPSRERLVKVYACIEIARFRLSASTLHPSPFTQKIFLEDFHRFVCFFVFLGDRRTSGGALAICSSFY